MKGLHERNGNFRLSVYSRRLKIFAIYVSVDFQKLSVVLSLLTCIPLIDLQGTFPSELLPHWKTEIFPKPKNLHYLFLSSSLDHAIDEKRATQGFRHWSIHFFAKGTRGLLIKTKVSSWGFEWCHTLFANNYDKNFSKILFHWKSRYHPKLGNLRMLISYWFLIFDIQRFSNRRTAHIQIHIGYASGNVFDWLKAKQGFSGLFLSVWARKMKEFCLFLHLELTA